MYIEITNNEKKEFAIHGTEQEVQNIYESLVFMANIEKDKARKNTLRKQFMTIEETLPKIEF